MLAAAWRAFRGDRTGTLLGPGPGFKEAIEAALAVADAERAAVLVDVLSALDAAVADHRTTAAEARTMARSDAAMGRLADAADAKVDGLLRLRATLASAAVRRLAGLADV